MVRPSLPGRFRGVQPSAAVLLRHATSTARDQPHAEILRPADRDSR